MTTLTKLEKEFAQAILNDRNAADFDDNFEELGECDMCSALCDIEWPRGAKSRASMIGKLAKKGLVQIDYNDNCGHYVKKGRRIVWEPSPEAYQFWWLRSELKAAINA